MQDLLTRLDAAGWLDTIQSVGILAVAFLAGIVIRGLLFLIVFRKRKPKAPREMELRDFLRRPEYWRGPLAALAPALCVLFAMPMTSFPTRFAPAIQQAVHLWLIISLAWLARRMVTMGRDVVLSRYQIDARDNLAARRVHTQLRVIERVIAVILIVLTVALMLMTFEKVRQVGISLLASAGVVGLILGFAAQRTLGTLFAGIQIAITQPMRLDDVVIVEGEWGRIEEITLTYVVVKIWDLRRLVVPITYFLEKPFQNWTRTEADILGTVFLYLDYHTPLETIRAELTRLLEQSPEWDRKVNGVQVTNTTERTVEVRCLMSAPDASSAWDLRCKVREGMLDFLQKNYPDSLPRLRVVATEKETA